MSVQALSEGVQGVPLMAACLICLLGRCSACGGSRSRLLVLARPARPGFVGVPFLLCTALARAQGAPFRPFGLWVCASPRCVVPRRRLSLVSGRQSSASGADSWSRTSVYFQGVLASYFQGSRCAARSSAPVRSLVRGGGVGCTPSRASDSRSPAWRSACHHQVGCGRKGVFELGRGGTKFERSCFRS